MDLLVKKGLPAAASSLKKDLKVDLKEKTLPDKGKRPPSPGDDKCPICLVVPIENKAIANKCFHSFCKVCLMEWAKVRMECPLCRQQFSAILYDIKNDDDFKEYRLEELLRDRCRSSPAFTSFHAGLFSRSIFSLSLNNPFYADSSAALASQLADRPVQPGTLEHRRYIYTMDLYCMSGGTGERSRRRESNPRFYTQNPAAIHRLRVFLILELKAIVHDANARSIVMQAILNSLTKSRIASTKFQHLISQYTLHRTTHFIHEFYNFAISVYDNAQRYYELAVYVPRSQAQIVQIVDDYEDQVFDLRDPYNYRISRGIYNDINNNVSPFGGNTSIASTSTAGSTPRSGSSAYSPATRRIEPEDDSSSDDDVIFEGITKATSTSDARRGRKDKQRLLNAKDAAQSPSTAASIAETAEPKPGPSGLSNNRINLTLNQLRSQYTEDSDSDYDSDNYLSRNQPNIGLRLFESDDEDEQKFNELKRRLEDSSDEENSIEYVGYVKPRHLRTPEVIEILTSDEEESEYNVQSNDDPFRPTKRPKVEQKEKSAEADRTVVKCKCKIRCKAECKRASV